MFLGGWVRVGGVGSFPRPRAVFPVKEMVVVRPRFGPGDVERGVKKSSKTNPLEVGSRCGDVNVSEFGGMCLRWEVGFGVFEDLDNA